MLSLHNSFKQSEIKDMTGRVGVDGQWGVAKRHGRLSLEDIDHKSFF